MRLLLLSFLFPNFTSIFKISNLYITYSCSENQLYLAWLFVLFFKEKETIMENEDQIITIEKFHETKLKEKNSLFIAQSYPIENEEDFQKILTEVKKKYYDANHHCYAYKLQNNLFKYSDDGEPNGYSRN